MRIIILSIMLLIFRPSGTAQGAYVSVGGGVSNMASNYDNQYSPNYNYTIKTVYDKYFSKLGIRYSFGYYNFSSKVLNKTRNLNINSIKISCGLAYKIIPTWSLSSQIQIGRIIEREILISSPSYNYRFDPIDLSYSVEILKNINMKDFDRISLSLEFSKSIDGIIDDNPWENDNLKPYYLNVNIYYSFNKK